jgi:hypothetical protein
VLNDVMSRNVGGDADIGKRSYYERVIRMELPPLLTKGYLLHHDSFTLT